MIAGSTILRASLGMRLRRYLPGSGCGSSVAFSDGEADSDDSLGDDVAFSEESSSASVVAIVSVRDVTSDRIQEVRLD